MLHARDIEVSLFIDPDEEQIDASAMSVRILLKFTPVNLQMHEVKKNCIYN